MQTIEIIGVVGAGQMGRGIAQVAAFCGYKVKIFDISKDSIDFALNFIKENLNKAVLKGKITQEEALLCLGNISTTTELKDFKNCDLAIEAATENKKINLLLKIDCD